ncbi:uncharacterized protein Setx [Prorops nasuta]|uniref:uncharacterized protein Setx n=1 Tax=Prorops nasuta TaxID=863751 RepID=UPI0034CE3436
MMNSSQKKIQFILKRIDNENAENIFITTNICTCGRGKENQIVCKGLAVSRKHCIFVREKDELHVLDLASSNGVYVNGKKQKAHFMVQLNNNDIIGIGCSAINDVAADAFAYKLHISELTDNETIEILDLPQTFKTKKEEAVSNNLKRRSIGQLLKNSIPSKISKCGDQKDVHTSINLSEGDSVIKNNLPQSKGNFSDELEILHISTNIRTENELISCHSNRKQNSDNNVTERVLKFGETNVCNSKNNLSNNGSLKDNEYNENLQVKSVEDLVHIDVHRTGSSDKKQGKFSTVMNHHRIKQKQDCSFQELSGSDKRISVNSDFGEVARNIDSTNVYNPNSLIQNNSHYDEMQGDVKELYKISSANNVIERSSPEEKRKVDFQFNNKEYCIQEDGKEYTDKGLRKSTNRKNEPKKPVKKKILSFANSSIISNNQKRIKTENFSLTSDENLENEIDDFSSFNEIPSASPIKLKKVKEEITTRFSEVDVVNLSDEEDNIFPCSQLFDNSTNINVKPEIKTECLDNNYVDYICDADDVIILSDSENEEENNWLQRLSRSQILKEGDNVNNEDKNVDEEEREITKELDLSVDEENELQAESNQDKDIIQISDSIHNDRLNIKDKGGMHSDLNDKEEMDEMVVPSGKITEIKYFGDVRIKSCSVVLNKLEVDKFKNKSKFSCDNASSTNVKEHFSTSRKPRSDYNKGILIVEAPHMLPKRKQNSKKGNEPASSKISDIKSSSKKPIRNDEELANQEILDEYLQHQQLQKIRGANKWAVRLPRPKSSNTKSQLTKEQKEVIRDERKAKLKELAIEELKKEVPENNKEQKRKATVRTKITKVNRSEYLIEDIAFFEKELTKKTTEAGIESKSNETDSCKFNNRPTEIPNSSVETDKNENNETHEATKGTLSLKEVSSQELAETVKYHSKIKKRSSHITSTNKKSKVTTTSKVSNDVKDQKENCQPKGVIQQSFAKPKKKVSFSKIIENVYEFEIEPRNQLRKLRGKDAPIPKEKLPMNINEIVKSNTFNFDEFLYRLLHWNPAWLTEQKHLNIQPPVVHQSELIPLLMKYKSFQDYYRITLPLLLLETWASITKEFETIERNKSRPTVMCSIVKNSITETTASESKFTFTTLMIEVLVTSEDLQRQTFPIYGDLVFFEYITNVSGSQEFHKVFAYVTNIHQTILSPSTIFNKDLKIYVKRPVALMTYTIKTRPLTSNIVVNRIQRLRTVTYLRSDMRMIQALQYLPISPLSSAILDPKVEMYQLPIVTDKEKLNLVTQEKLNKKQMEAVMRVTETVINKQAKICLIQGPPGTGKSKVIVNTITQILYGENRYKTNSSTFRILVCAPSNAAIDEIVLRLLKIRSLFKNQGLKCFKMVRIGRLEMMHPLARDISVTELAKRDIRRMKSAYTNNVPIESVESEKLTLQARINALRIELASTQNINELYKKNIKMKLDSMVAQLSLLEKCKEPNHMTLRETNKLQRASENKIILGADIITCTLSSCYTNQMESIFCGNKEKISVCIVDEATQSCEAETLIPLMLGINTLILVGDPNQLPATVLSQQAKLLGLDKSLFARVQNAFEGEKDNPIIMLDTQYRMDYAISYWPNKFFYGGKLKNSMETNYEFPYHSYRVLNLDSLQNNDKFSNTNEAEFIANLIYGMYLHKDLPKVESKISVGILTPYNNQRSLVQNKIQEKLSKLDEILKRKLMIEVNTVDSFQGQERDVIIMSCTRSSGIGFLSDRQRICVALTRAKHSLILCGNFKTFTRDQMWKALLSDARSRGIYFDVNAKSQVHEIQKYVFKL